MRKRLVLLVGCCALLLTFCASPSPNPGVTHTPSVPSPVVTETVTTPGEIPTPTAMTTGTVETPGIPTGTATAAAPSGQQFIAYAQNGQLLVTDVTGGVQGGTTQYTLAGVDDQVGDIVWSPSGEYVAYVSYVTAEPHIFYIFALGQSTPTDLGPGSLPAWSPDSQSIAYVRGPYPDENVWVTTIENPAPRQLTFETNHAWGRPAFTPDGQSLIVTEADRMTMGAQGNTNFILESLALDGSGGRASLPGATMMEAVRLPYDLRFSPDGQKLAFSTSYHLSACVSPGAYYVSDVIGGNRQELISPSLRPAIDPNKETYHVGLSYAWTPNSDALIIFGNVLDCALNSPTMGQSVAGPQLSILGLDGNERLVIPGFFMNPSMDRSGTMIATAHHQDFQDTQPQLEIYSAQTGQFMLSLGTGSYPVFQP